MIADKKSGVERPEDDPAPGETIPDVAPGWARAVRLHSGHGAQPGSDRPTRVDAFLAAGY